MTLPIVTYGSSLLREKTEIIKNQEEIKALSDNMIQTLKKSGGVGLAGPQVGIKKSIFIIDTTPFNGKDISPFVKICINPRIINYNKKRIFYPEGCLSIPGIYEDVSRPQKIEVTYMDINLEEKKEELDGIEARIFQHEYDHLQGILFIDRLSPLKKKLIKRRLNKIKKETTKKLKNR